MEKVVRRILPSVYHQVLVLGFATVYSDWAMLPREVVLGLSQPFVDGSSANAGVVLRGMWDVNQVGAWSLEVVPDVGPETLEGTWRQGLAWSCFSWDSIVEIFAKSDVLSAQKLVLDLLVEFYSHDFARIERVLDVIRELQVRTIG